MLIFVHGMGSNFYRSALKKAFLEVAPSAGLAILSFNNRGADRGTEKERFSWCRQDLDAALQWGRRRGHRHFILVGHSTGCQKLVYWHSVRRSRLVGGLVLLAPADDYAIIRRQLGRRYSPTVAWARQQVAAGKTEARAIPGLYERFSPARFLSLALPRSVEANLFRYNGRMTAYRRLTCPLLAVFGTQEEFAVIPPAEMLAILRRKTQSRDFEDWLVAGADHGFHGYEYPVAHRVCQWARERFG